MKIYKIVFTGGPCGGKTKILENLKSYLKELDYNVIIVPESAREIIASGILPNPKDKNYTLWFQELLIKYQNLKEKNAENYAKKQNKDTIILYDRAIPDNFAYLENYEDYKNLLDKNNINELELIDSYDLIINLSSLANYDEFNYENDEERQENKDLTKILDYKTSTAYLLSRNMKVIYPTDNIEEKYNIIINHINNLLNNKEEKELITYEIDTDYFYLSDYNDDNSRILTTINYYLDNEINDYEYILSIRKYKKNKTYTLTKQIRNDNIITTIYNKLITEEEFYNIKNKYKRRNIMGQKEISFMYDNKKYKIIIDDVNNGILEIENSNFLSEIKIPDNIKFKNNFRKVKKYDNIDKKN